MYKINEHKDCLLAQGKKMRERERINSECVYCKSCEKIPYPCTTQLAENMTIEKDSRTTLFWTSCCNKTSKNLLHIDTKRSEILQNPAQEVTAKDEMDQGNDFKASG